MADREHCDELGDVLEVGQEEHHAEEEKQVVIAREHVRDAESDVLQVAATEHALAVRFGDAVGQGVKRQADGNGQGREGQ